MIRFLGPQTVKFFEHEFPKQGTKLRHKTKGFTMYVGSIYVEGSSNIPKVGLLESYDLRSVNLQHTEEIKIHRLLLEDIVKDWKTIGIASWYQIEGNAVVIKYSYRSYE